MAFTPTAEQEAIIGAPLVSQCVVACAGSGKTATAVRRLLAIRQRLGRDRGYVALLSYSNVAVDTFRSEYSALSPPDVSPRVYIGTVDAFITSHIILPHAARLMGCAGQPFLVHGGEPFLQGYTVHNGDYPVGIENLRVTVDSTGTKHFSLQPHNGAPVKVDSRIGEAAIARLSSTGAYTHDTGRYWTLRTLREQPALLRILARRYPYVLVDEAQDVGSVHGTILKLLQATGSVISLIGDPNQAIFEFADADGSFLQQFAGIPGVLSQPLSQNRRSVETIVAVGSAVSKTVSRPFRANPDRTHGAYYITYSKDAEDNAVGTFVSILEQHHYSLSEAIVLCRGSTLVHRLTGEADQMGQGATEKFVKAAISRDRQENIKHAFESVLDGTLKLLDRAPKTLRRDVLCGATDETPRVLRRILWRFLRDAGGGLPPATLPAKSMWQTALKARMTDLLQVIEKVCGLKPADNWKNKLTAARLPDSPLVHDDGTGRVPLGLRISNVHQAKGETVGAVLYIAKSTDLTSLLAGPKTEEGRIGYVAVTRAKDLLFIAVPAMTKKAIVRDLENAGFKRWT